MASDEILKFFAKYIEAEVGIIYSEDNYFQLQNRLEEISKLQGLDSVQGLYEKAKQSISGSFKQLILDTATNNETSFFRDPKVFKAFENTALPDLITKKMIDQELRLWSAACSYGQEPLSLSILFAEFLLRSPHQFNVKITATDICDRAIVRARDGVYNQFEVERGLSTPLLLKYFKKDEQDRWIASKDLSKMIEHKSLNLKNPFQFSQKFHVIFCRNVLIYQSIESKIDIIKRMSQCLMSEGFLVLGTGESLLGLSDQFESVPAEGAILYRLKKSN